MSYVDPDTQREYQRRWVARRRKAWFAGKSCIDCGATGDLEIDHLDPAEKISHSVWSWSAARRKAELAKCVVRCSRCHADRHEAMWSHLPHKQKRHGWSRYKHGCRCEVCRAAARAKWRRDYQVRQARQAAA